MITSSELSRIFWAPTWKHGRVYMVVRSDLRMQTVDGIGILCLRFEDVLQYQYCTFFEVDGRKVFHRVFKHLATGELLRSSEPWLTYYLKG